MNDPPAAPVILVTVSRQPSAGAVFVGTFAKYFLGTLAVLALTAVVAVGGLIIWVMSLPTPH